MSSLLVVAFPTLGKTTFVSKSTTWVDLDFGGVRKQFGITSTEWKSSPKMKDVGWFYTKSIDLLRSRGLNVLTNDVTYSLPSHPSVVLIPDYGTDEYVRRMRERGDADSKWIPKFISRWDKMLSDWTAIATKHHIPVRRCHYISDLLTD